jgi:hypothetical protein
MSTSSAIRHSPIITVDPYDNQLVREFPPMSREAVDNAAHRYGPPDQQAAPTLRRDVRGRPTLISNVETFAYLALIARFGPGCFHAQRGGFPRHGADDAGRRCAPGVYALALGVTVEEAIATHGWHRDRTAGRPDWCVRGSLACRCREPARSRRGPGPGRAQGIVAMRPGGNRSSATTAGRPLQSANASP